MEDYKEIFKREVDRLSYLYAKANTKSKKRSIAYDLIFFEQMYNMLVDEKIEFPWNNDEDIIEFRMEITLDMVQSVLDNQDFLIELVGNIFNIFLQSDFSIYGDYGKKYHKLSMFLLQKYIVKFLDTLDGSLKWRFKDKLDNTEIIINNTIEKYRGLTFPNEITKKHVIFITTGEEITIDEARVLVHELGHDFEFMNANNNGVTSVWSKLIRTVYPEVCPCFFEYAFINYLIDNNLYKDEGLMLKRKYLNEIYYYCLYALIIYYQSNLNIDNEFRLKMDNEEVVLYANKLLDIMNSSDDRFKLGDKINFRSTFVYFIGRLMGIYIYELYKENPKEFLSLFKTALLEYKDTGLKAFSHLGITEEELLDGKVLKRTLKDCK